MIELAKHIEVLLLKNDCVIVPGLGGFIAHYHSSTFNRETGEFLPPMRSIGFNPQLVMNDGLLVQSYMQAYNTDFPDATRKIGTIVEKLKDDLYQKGQVNLHRLGTLYYNMHGVYVFEPVAHRFFTPSLYGLERVALKRLAPTHESAYAAPSAPTPKKTVKMTDGHLSSSLKGKWIRNIAATAAAVIMFFLLSTPVENTYVDHMDYASLGGGSMFDAIRKESAVSFISGKPQIPSQNIQRIKSNVNTLKPVSVKTEKIMVSDIPKAGKEYHKEEGKKQPVEKIHKVTPAGGKKHFIIAASLQTKKEAEKELRRLTAKGYKKAQIVEFGGRYRIAIAQFKEKEEAQKKLQVLKTTHADLQSAWIFTSK